MNEHNPPGEARAVGSETPSTPGRLGRSVAPGILLVAGLAGALASVRLGLGSLSRPQPGLWPLTICVLISLAALALLVRPTAEGLEQWTRRSLFVIGGIALIAAYIGLVETLGFLVPSAVLLVIWLRVFGHESWRTTILLAVIGPVVLHLVFVNLLGVPLPNDLLLRSLT